jgi:hypothetical protein
MIISLPVMQTNNAQNQPSATHPEPDKRTPLLRIEKYSVMHALSGGVL